jgi:hypothetical protein
METAATLRQIAWHEASMLSWLGVPEANCDVSHPGGSAGRDSGFGDDRSTKLAKFTEPARLKAADGGVADGIGPADVHQGLTGFPSRNGFLPLVVRQFRLPRALARSLPSPVRLLINSRSNSARRPRIVSSAGHAAHSRRSHPPPR